MGVMADLGVLLLFGGRNSFLACKSQSVFPVTTRVQKIKRKNKRTQKMLIPYAIGLFLHVIASIFSVLLSSLNDNDERYELACVRERREHETLERMYALLSLGLLWPLAYPALILGLGAAWIAHGCVQSLTNTLKSPIPPGARADTSEYFSWWRQKKKNKHFLFF